MKAHVLISLSFSHTTGYFLNNNVKEEYLEKRRNAVNSGDGTLLYKPPTKSLKYSTLKHKIHKLNLINM